MIGTLGTGDEIDVVSEEGDWVKVIFNGTVAYVASSYLSDTKPVPETTASVEEATVEQNSNTVTYILNTNTKKFHYPSCRSVKQMKESNKRESYDSRDTVISQGYNPCGNCHP